MTTLNTDPFLPVAPPAPVLECPTGRWWLCSLLGLVLFAAGLFLLWNVVAASIVTAIFFSAALIVGGVFQLIHAFSARGWQNLVLSTVIGILLVIGGFFLAMDPLATSLGLTLGIAAIIFASGVVRLVLAWRHWHDHGWILLLSGIIAIIFGLVLFAGFPWSGLFIPGILLAVDFMMHGLWWLALGLFVRRPAVAAAR